MMDKRKSVVWFVAVLVLVVLLLAGEATVTIYRFDGPRLAAIYVVYIVAVGSAIGALVWVIDRWCENFFVPLVSLFISFLIFSLRLSFFGFVIEMPLPWYAALFFVTWAVMAWLLSVGLRRNRVPYPVFSAAALIVLMAPVVLSLGNLLSEAMVQRGQEQVLPSLLSRRNLPAGWEQLVFKERPNIYLLSIDSLIPADIARVHLSIDKPAYYRLVPSILKEIPRALMFEVPSLRALNSVMRLEQQRLRQGADAFTGGDNSVLSGIALANSYDLITGWPGHVPSWRRGVNVTELLTPQFARPVKEYFLCEVSGGVSRKYLVRALFFCRVLELLDVNHPESYEERVPFRDLVASRALEVAAGSRPTIFFTYIYDPIGHTDGDFDSTSLVDRGRYRANFLRQSELAAEFLDNTINAIRNFDRTAIIIVFGDHGAWLSRTSDPRVDPNFFYSDRHRVFLAVAQGGHACGHPAINAAEQRFFTPSRYLFVIFSCLAGREVGVSAEFIEDTELVKFLFNFE